MVRNILLVAYVTSLKKIIAFHLKRGLIWGYAWELGKDRNEEHRNADAEADGESFCRWWDPFNIFLN